MTRALIIEMLYLIPASAALLELFWRLVLSSERKETGALFFRKLSRSFLNCGFMRAAKLVTILGAMEISGSMSTCREKYCQVKGANNEELYLQVGSEGVWEPHVPGEGREDEVPHLDTVGWDDVTEAVVVVTEELGEVVEQDEEDPESPAVQSEDDEVRNIPGRIKAALTCGQAWPARCS